MRGLTVLILMTRHMSQRCGRVPIRTMQSILKMLPKASTYEQALRLGDKRVCYISARELFGEKDRDCCMADTAHPTDLGAMRMADSIYLAVSKMF